MATQIVKFDVVLTAEQAEHIAELERIERQEDELHSRRGTKRKGPRRSEVMLTELETAAEVEAINRRSDELQSIMLAAQRAARTPAALLAFNVAAIDTVLSQVQARLAVSLLRLAKGESLDLLADLASVHPAALVLLALGDDERKALAKAMTAPAMAHPGRNPAFDLDHRIGDEKAEAARLYARRREIAPTAEERQLDEDMAAFDRLGYARAPER